MPSLTFSTAITAAHRPLTTPADRSISPRSRIRTTPIEMVPTAAICKVRLTRLNESRKTPFEVIWKIVQIAISPTMTGSWPMSRCAMRRR
jgi:hypothetical protein